MKFNFLKFKRNNLPPLQSLRPRIFNADLLWFISLGAALVIFIITAFIGLKLFYSQYFESYKQSRTGENFENLININRLKNTVESRNNLINKKTLLSQDPSL
jgi:uncharacterized membrane protein